jgi:L,D-peptidoglycan transpeptidase YkuD (ErfK/YbiS/YcfS/YnhG family)
VKRGLSRITATRMPRHNPNREFPLGRLHAGNLALTCALGRAGVTNTKFEGDHATPAGKFRLLGGFFRPDRVRCQAWPLPMAAAKPHDGWCDDPESASYNRRVSLPCRARHENLWRGDGLYDLLAVLDYNIYPRLKYRGSAIFLHCAPPDFAPTEGCLALRFDDLRRLLPRLSSKTVLIIK